MATAYHRVLCRAIVVTADNNTIIFREDGSGTDRTATLTPGTYYLVGANVSGDILNQIIDQMTAVSGVAAGYGVDAASPSTTSPGFSWTISTDSTSFAFMSSGTTFDLASIGWDSANSGSFAATYTLSAPASVIYSPTVISSVQDPAGYDNDGVYHHRRPDGSAVTGKTSDPVRRWPLLWEYVPKGLSLIRHEAGDENSWEQFWRDINDGVRLRLYEGTIANIWSPTKVAEGYLSIDSRQRFDVTRDSDVPTFRIEATFIEDMTA